MFLESRFVIPVVRQQMLSRFVRVSNRAIIQRKRNGGLARNVDSLAVRLKQLPGGIFSAIVKSNQVQIVERGNVAQARGVGVEGAIVITVSDRTGGAQQR